MKFEIYGGKKQVPIELSLIQSGDTVYLVAVDPDGFGFGFDLLLSINKKGRIELNEKVNQKFGFDLDELGRIKIED